MSADAEQTPATDAQTADKEPQAQQVNPVGFTSQITAAFRAVELQCSSQPIIVDQLAPYLGKVAWDTAYTDWQQLVQQQGPDKSLRVPARNRLMDDLLLQTLRQLGTAGQQRVQVVNIGCGMDSKPWRLHLPVSVAWFDVDQPGVIELKQQLLQEAGAAALREPQSPCNAAADSGSTSGPCNTHSSSRQQQQSVPPTVARFPLLVQSWCPVPADLSHTPLHSSLRDNGFDADCPTVWMAEALLYYIPLNKALQLLADMRSVSAPGSKLLATCIDRELYIANHQQLDKGHYFHAMWHFSVDELLSANPPRLQAAGWTIDMQPRTTAELAQEYHGRETYVPLYGGAECVFTAGLCDTPSMPTLPEQTYH